MAGWPHTGNSKKLQGEHAVLISMEIRTPSGSLMDGNQQSTSQIARGSTIKAWRIVWLPSKTCPSSVFTQPRPYADIEEIRPVPPARRRRDHSPMQPTVHSPLASPRSPGLTIHFQGARLEASQFERRWRQSAAALKLWRGRRRPGRTDVAQLPRTDRTDGGPTPSGRASASGRRETLEVQAARAVLGGAGSSRVTTNCELRKPTSQRGGARGDS
jgi:hypothetical protein